MIESEDRMYLIGASVDGKQFYKLVKNPNAMKYEYNFEGKRVKPDFIIPLPKTIQKQNLRNIHPKLTEIILKIFFGGL